MNLIRRLSQKKENKMNKNYMSSSFKIVFYYILQEFKLFMLLRKKLCT